MAAVSAVFATSGIMYSFSEAEGLTVMVIGISHGSAAQLDVPVNFAVMYGSAACAIPKNEAIFAEMRSRMVVFATACTCVPSSDDRIWLIETLTAFELPSVRRRRAEAFTVWPGTAT
jgi:hypothetical protein